MYYTCVLQCICMYSHPGLDRIWNCQSSLLKWDDIWESPYSIYLRMTVYIYIYICMYDTNTYMCIRTYTNCIHVKKKTTHILTKSCKQQRNYPQPREIPGWMVSLVFEGEEAENMWGLARASCAKLAYPLGN